MQKQTSDFILLRGEHDDTYPNSVNSNKITLNRRRDFNEDILENYVFIETTERWDEYIHKNYLKPKG